MFERFAGAFGDAVRRVFGDAGFYARATENELCKIAQLRGATRHRDAVVDDVGGKLRRRFLQDVFHRLNHRAEFFAYRAHDLIRTELHRARQSREVVAALYHHRELFFRGYRRADLDFYFLRHFVADAEVGRLLYVVRNGVVDGVARAFDRGGRDDAAERNDRDVGRAAADVYYHVALCLVNGNARADCREYRLFDHVRFF